MTENWKVDMKPGDLIEIFRLGYQHWAVYVGDGNVVHLARQSEFANDGGGNSSWFMGIIAVVKKEKLSEVVGKDCYHVNKFNFEYPVRDPEYIVFLANRLVGKITYKVFTNNSEHFANYLHYDMPRSDQVRFGWEQPSNKLDMEPGDLIEIFRRGYEHWAVYVGDGDVVHLPGPSEFAGANSSLFTGFPAVVKKEKLSDVVGDSRYHVNNKHDWKYHARDPEYIVYLANRRVGNKITYKLFTNNCEHFATSLRNGLHMSDQVFHFGLLLAAVRNLFWKFV